MYNESPFDHNV